MNQDGLKIYYNNYYYTLIKALKSVYPTLLKLVGEDYFEIISKKYIKQYPSTSYSLYNYGKYFSEFILNQLESYYSEVAKLEWAIHEIYYAKDNKFLDIQRLNVILEKNYEKLRFYLQPASRLFEFNYPVLSIWELCHKNQNMTVNLDQGPEKILVIRREREILFEKLTHGEYALLSAFEQGTDFKTACMLALKAEPGFNISDYMQRCVLNQTIGGFL